MFSKALSLLSTTTVLLLPPLLFLVGVSSYEYHISNAEDLIQFSKDVNNGKTYSGTTVFLDADINFSGDLSDEFEPIGKDWNNYYFEGTLNGQGYTISNLAIKSSSLLYVGLFGYSKGTTIRNVVLDSSCSVVSSYSGSNNVFSGGVIGECDDCTIENNVNMASASFTGSTDGNLYIGGIVGSIEISNSEVIVKNCANYGFVTNSGTATSGGRPIFIGGIVGKSYGSSPYKVYVQNCLNYGTINHNGSTAGNLNVGGIIGGPGYNVIESCVSGGKIVLTTLASGKNYIGSVAGYIDYETAITHCYWTSDVGNYSTYGSRQSAVNIDNETKQVTLNTTIVDSLSNYNSSWDKWFMLYLNKGNINNLNQASLVVTQKLFPDPVKEGNTFLFWCLDTECNEKYDPNITNITNVSGFYAVWNISTVTFDPAGGVAATSSKNVVYGQKYGELPSETRTGHTFLGWFTEKEEGKGEKVTENDIVKNGFDYTLYAQWTVNNYTVTFDFGNGTVVLPTSEFTVTYDKPYNCLPNATRTGHTFLGWFTEKNGGIEVANKTTANITADNHTLYAQWTANNYTLTFDFGNGTVVNGRFTYNETIIYPKNLTREGCAFSGWKPKPERMPANDTTVVAQWIENAMSEIIKIVFSKKDMTKDEITEIIKGFTKDNFTIKEFGVNENGSLVVIIRFNDAMSAKNFVEAIAVNGNDLFIESISFINEHPFEQKTEYVEITFDAKDLSEREIREILSDYTKEEFTIERFKVDEAGNTIVIIKFNDSKKASEFVNSVNVYSKASPTNYIKRVGFASADDFSFSMSVQLFSFLFMLL